MASSKTQPTQPKAETSPVADILADSNLVAPSPVVDQVVRDADEAMQRARAALEAAEAEFAAAEFVAERARIEDQKRRDRAEDQRIGRLGQDLPKLEVGVEYDLNQFRLCVAGIRSDGRNITDVVRAWLQMSVSRDVHRRVIAQITAHTAKRSAESFTYWERKVAEWDVLLREVLQYRPSDFPIAAHEDDEANANDEKAAEEQYAAALAKVNETITEQSKEAPIPLTRRPDDISVPGPMSLGVFTGPEIAFRNPLFRENPLPRDFAADLNEALVHAVQAEVDVYMPGIAPLPLGGVTVAQARAGADAAVAKMQAFRDRDAADDTAEEQS